MEEERREFTVDPTHRTFTDEQGYYEVPLTAGKPYKVLATGVEYSFAWTDVFEVGKDERVEVEELRLRRGTLAIDGVVVDPAGQPVERAVLYVSSKNKGQGRDFRRPTTDVQGRFRIEYLLEGELLDLRVNRAGYERRSYVVAPGATGLRLEIHPSESGYRDWNKRTPDPQDAVGKPAPAWSIGRWVRKPLAPARPDRQDGKASVLILSKLNSAHWEEIREQAKVLETICERHDAVATVIFSGTVHESVVELYLQDLGSRVGVAIDRFVPESDYQLSDATFIAYGFRRSLSVFVISSDGIVTHAMRDLEGLDAALGQ